MKFILISFWKVNYFKYKIKKVTDFKIAVLPEKNASPKFDLCFTKESLLDAIRKHLKNFTSFPLK